MSGGPCLIGVDFANKIATAKAKKERETKVFLLKNLFAFAVKNCKLPRPCLVVLLFLLAAFPVFAQDDPGAAVSGAPVEQNEATADSTATLSIRDQEIIELDIKTSTLSELAAWCRSLGLSEGGDREALGNRIREHYRIAQAVAAAGGVSVEIEGEGGPKTITIESARSTEYFTLDVVDEEYARLRGDVVISLKDGDSVHRITAWELLYNRSRNLLSASGGVEYVKESGDTIETFRGESITVDLDNWSSIFMDGVSERSLSGEETTYRFSGNIISRSAEEATVLSRASISNASNEEALWSLSASKIWLLPGSDFALLNGFLKVGEIPVLYIPVFFFPADEVVFHPVLGYRSREGSFFQTTTYILGRPQADSTTETSSISKILGNSSDMEKTRHGIFLRSTGKKSRDPNTTRLSVLLDAYANLGFYAGTELALPKKGIFNEYKLSLGIGRSRDVVKIGNNSVYTPFPNYDGTSEWNSAYLGGLSVPFRFRMTNAGSLSGKYGTFSWSLPYYSDQFMDRDFLDRSEEMDYIKLLKNESSATETEANLTKNITGSYEWRVSGSSTFSLPSLAPYITSLSVSNLSSFINFNYRNSYKLLGNNDSPERTFYYPDKFTIYSISASVSGTPLSLGGGTTTTSQTTANQTTASPEAEEEEPDLFRGLGVPSAPWTEEEAGGGSAVSQGWSDPNALTPPVISQRFDLPRAGGLRFSIAYQLSPTSATELKFDSTAGTAASPHWNEAEDVDWSEFSSILFSGRSDGNATFSLSDTNNLVTTNLRLTGSGSLQKYSYLNEDSMEYDTEAKVNTAKIRAMSQTSFTTSAEFTTTVRPFYLSSVWSNTNFQYSIKNLIAKSVLKDTASNNPDDAWYDVSWGRWERDSLEGHKLAANLQASVMNKAQNLSVTTEMPPEETFLTNDATIRVWISETNFNSKIRDPYENPFYEPMRFTETLRFTSSFSASQTIIYDPEKDEFTSMTSSLSFYGLTASFTSTYAATYKLELDATNQWKWNSYPESFEPREFRLAYVRTFKKDELWEKRLSYSLGFNTSLALDLQRFTNSSFNFTLSCTLGISKFLDLTLGTTSTNGSIYRYFRDWGIFDVPADLPVIGETNVFKDLANSFRFDDEQLRGDSGFKLKSFNLSLLHHMGDWNAKLDITLSPYLDNKVSPPQYEFNTEVSFVVQWLPISEIKTEIIHNKDTFEFK
jgi:lipopolysaccharide assembly outer membrane protein LptD (OstA)